MHVRCPHPSTSPAPDTPLTHCLASLSFIASSIIEKAPNAPLDALAEENVRAPVANLSKAPAVRDSWEGGRLDTLLVYKIEDGTLADSGMLMGPDVDREAEKEKFSLEGMCTCIRMTPIIYKTV
ncbi:hypothetical protein FIBSPDRAFT_851528 [Athelia psychrophila]|uniref:Uncharacterized protein n=1 Tax=Athelia psychrophila TaxID=1759441 RepID=A0A166SL99_9AGAM|nr:hypothetical protein FIBSPDRAFT_851528 [Fibularhizoctonia sp. CBS 109695]